MGLLVCHMQDSEKAPAPRRAAACSLFEDCPGLLGCLAGFCTPGPGVGFPCLRKCAMCPAGISRLAYFIAYISPLSTVSLLLEIISRQMRPPITRINGITNWPKSLWGIKTIAQGKISRTSAERGRGRGVKVCHSKYEWWWVQCKTMRT